MMQLFGTHIQIQKLYKKNCKKDLNQIQKWSNDWRMKLSIQKTEYSIFSKEKNKVQNIKLKLGNTILKYNPNPVILGLKLDEQLNFNSHIESTVKKAKRSLGIIREIKGIALIPTKTLIQIYDSLVCSIFNYASSIWQSSTSSHLDKLNEIQRKGLALCLDLPSQSSLEALEVLSGTLPIDLRREEMAIRELGKINSYNMKDTELVDIDKIEPQYEYQGLVSVIRAPDYWRNIGSSKSRTTAQIEEGKQIISEQLQSQTPNTAVAFTDGSCLGNPGPCGAGAIIYINDKEEKLKRPVSNKGSILLAELIAIKMVLDYIESFSKEQINTLTLFSDSQTALGILTLNWKSDSYHQTINEIKGKIKNLNEHGFLINLNWTPGHANIKGNDEADSLAKEAAKEAETLAVDDIVFTKQDVKKAARNSVTKKWQRRWENSDTGRHYFRFHPEVKDKVKKDFPSKKMYNIINSLRTGYSKLNAYQFIINQHINSETCHHCKQKENVQHYLFECDLYSDARDKLFHQIYFITGQIPTDLDNLLTINLPNAENINQLLAEYIEETNRFSG
ncbi:RNASEH1 [Mytilus edulis]|uniref:ribonuclease H n=1 Tax=Mytilus edulis TaxID=6550 RepID=A0A8S3S5H3_MYTED|nr:RNASEH1 [Mytilus edulis]